MIPTEDIKSTRFNEQYDADESEDDGEHDVTDDTTHDEHDEAKVKPILQVDGNDSFSSESSNYSYHKIPVHTTNRNNVNVSTVNFGPQNLHTVQRSNKFHMHFTFQNSAILIHRVFTTNGKSL